MIHGDFNEQNVVMSVNSAGGTWDVSALLDFGDSQYSCYLFELAVNLCYMLLISMDLPDPLESGGHVIAGYSTIRPLPDSELELLKVNISSLFNYWKLGQTKLLGIFDDKCSWSRCSGCRTEYQSHGSCVV